MMGYEYLILNCVPIILVITATVMILKALPDVGMLKCPICSANMHLIYGCGWDHDILICDDKDCDGEIELETSTYPPVEDE